MNGYKFLVVVAAVVSSTTAFADSETDMRNAKKLYERMTGVKVSAKKPEVKAVADLLAKGKQREAAAYITKTSDFLNVQIKNLSLRLSNKDESVKVGFNDFSALIVGVIRDNKDFREILTADYYYDVKGVADADDQRTRFFNQNNYVLAETNLLDLTKALVFQPRQKMVLWSYDTPYTASQKPAMNGVIKLEDNPEPSGVLTTRTFAERNLSGGSNRRAVEFSLKQFLCVSMAEAADSSASDQYVGRDVERFPAGDYNKYLTSCKSCHAVMDGMRPAFAKVDYVNFQNSTTTGNYSHMHGDFFSKNDIGRLYTDYLKDTVTPETNVIMPDLEINQENSVYYKTRYNFMIARGTAAAQAKSTLDGVLNTIRDPKILADLIVDFRAKKQAVLADLRTNRNNADYRTTYVKACLDNFNSTALTAQVQEEKFLQCNLDNKKDMSVLYAYYDEVLTAQKVSQEEKDRLLGKLINKGRNSPANLMVSYLQAIDKLKLYARSSFDSSTGVATKMNKGSYPYGFMVTSDAFVNNATLGSKATFFGWRGPNKTGGNGLKDFGRMLGDSRRFSQCMAKRVYESVCMKKLDSAQYTTLVRLGDRFEALDYNMKSLYQDIALDPACGLLKEQ